MARPKKQVVEKQQQQQQPAPVPIPPQHIQQYPQHPQPIAAVPQPAMPMPMPPPVGVPQPQAVMPQRVVEADSFLRVRDSVGSTHFILYFVSFVLGRTLRPRYQPHPTHATAHLLSSWLSLPWLVAAHLERSPY